MADNILQNEVLTDFVYPFLLVFFIVFAVLEKTNALGKDRKQLNALLSAVIGLIFVASVHPKMIISDLMLFLGVALVIIFVIWMIFGFAVGAEKTEVTSPGLKWAIGIVVILALIFFIFYTTGIYDEVYDWLFKNDWSSDVWTNVIFFVIIAAAIAISLKGASKGSS
jgi:hypothetical protein